MGVTRGQPRRAARLPPGFRRSNSAGHPSPWPRAAGCAVAALIEAGAAQGIGERAAAGLLLRRRSEGSLLAPGAACARRAALLARAGLRLVVEPQGERDSFARLVD